MYAEIPKSPKSAPSKISKNCKTAVKAYQMQKLPHLLSKKHTTSHISQINLIYRNFLSKIHTPIYYLLPYTITILFLKVEKWVYIFSPRFRVLPPNKNKKIQDICLGKRILNSHHRDTTILLKFLRA